MLQRVLSNVLQQYAHQYLANVEADLSLSLWGGDVVLNNVELRLDAIHRALSLPPTLRLERGSVRELRVHVPWAALATRPVEVGLRGVEITVAHRTGPAPSPASSSASEGAPAAAPAPAASPLASASESGLAPPEASSTSSGGASGSGGGGAGGGWAADLLTKIVANLSLRIEDLAVRFEQGRAFAAVELGTAAIFSVDEHWRPAFVDLEGPWRLLRKECELSDLRITLGTVGASPQTEDALLHNVSATVRLSTYTAATRSFHQRELGTFPLPTQACGARTRIDVVFAQAVELSLHDDQFALAMEAWRTLSASLPVAAAEAAAAPGTTPSAAASATLPAAAAPKAPPARTRQGSAAPSTSDGWLGWAWNYVAPEPSEPAAEVDLPAHMAALAPRDGVELALALPAIALALRSARSGLGGHAVAHAGLDFAPSAAASAARSRLAPVARPVLSAVLTDVRLALRTGTEERLLLDVDAVVVSDETGARARPLLACGDATWLQSKWSVLHGHQFAPLGEKPARTTAPLVAGEAAQTRGTMQRCACACGTMLL